MSELDANGSYIYEPSVSEASLARSLENIWELLPPNERTRVTITYDLSDKSNNLTLARALKEISAATSHTIGNSVTIRFSINKGYGTLDPQRLSFSLPGTDELTAELECDQDEHCYTSRLVDASGRGDIARHDVQIATVLQLLQGIGAPTKIDVDSDAAIVRSLSGGLLPNDTLRIDQYQLLYQDIIDDENGVGSTLELARSVILGPDEISEMIYFTESINHTAALTSRVTKLTKSEHGTVLSVEEKVKDESNDSISSRKVTISYDLIEKLQSHMALGLKKFNASSPLD